jgi:predicted membrane protein
MRKKGQGFLTMGGDGPWGIFILNTIILLLIFATGNISSSLFFLLYFLGFGIAFVFEPLAIFVFIVGAVLIFLPDTLRGDVFGNLIKTGSLLLISPLAYFFGKEYRKSDKQEGDIEALEERAAEAANTISEDVEEVIRDEKANLKEQDVQKLNEILEETEDLRDESKNHE